MVKLIEKSIIHKQINVRVGVKHIIWLVFSIHDNFNNFNEASRLSDFKSISNMTTYYAKTLNTK